MKRNGSGIMSRTATTMMVGQIGVRTDPKVRQPLPVLPERSDDHESRDILGLAEDLRGLGSRTSVLRSGKRACSKSKARQRRIFPKLSLGADMHADEDEDGRGEVDRGDADGRGQKQSPGSDLL